MHGQERSRPLEEEIERRIEILKTGTAGKKPFSARDYALVTIVVLLCLAAVIWGAWL